LEAPPATGILVGLAQISDDLKLLFLSSSLMVRLLLVSSELAD
jgi:hypothetical protein